MMRRGKKHETRKERGWMGKGQGRKSMSTRQEVTRALILSSDLSQASE